MGIIAWIIVGALAGWIASMIMGNEESQGAIGNIIVGIVGGLVGGFIMNALGSDGGGLLYTTLVAIGGACLVLFVKLRVLKV